MLFAFYGSLMRNMEGFKRSGIGEGKTLYLEEVLLPGYLLDCGKYPGLILNKGSKTKAELHQLLDLSVLPDIDAFENYDSQRPSFSEFLRQTVYCLDSQIQVQTYVYQGDTEKPRVLENDWRKALEKKLW